MGAARPGDAVITIGTSAVACAADAEFRPAPHDALLTSPHAAPGRLPLDGRGDERDGELRLARRADGTDVAGLAAEVDAFAASGRAAEAPVCRPSLTGVRTPARTAPSPPAR